MKERIGIVAFCLVFCALFGALCWVVSFVLLFMAQYITTGPPDGMAHIYKLSCCPGLLGAMIFYTSAIIGRCDNDCGWPGKKGDES